MSYTIQVNEEFWRITFSATMTHHDLQELAERVMHIDKRDRVESRGLVDLSALSDVNIHFESVHSFVKALPGRYPPQIVRAAIIAGNPIQYGFARMFQQLMDHPKLEIRIFKRETDACARLADKKRSLNTKGQ